MKKAAFLDETFRRETFYSLGVTHSLHSCGSSLVIVLYEVLYACGVICGVLESIYVEIRTEMHFSLCLSADSDGQCRARFRSPLCSLCVCLR